MLYRCSTDALPGFLRCWREYRRPLPEWRLWGCCERAGELLNGDKMPAGRPSQAAGRCGEKTESPVTSGNRGHTTHVPMSAHRPIRTLPAPTEERHGPGGGGVTAEVANNLHQRIEPITRRDII